MEVKVDYIQSNSRMHIQDMSGRLSTAADASKGPGASNDHLVHDMVDISD